jgi:PRC-barrel domain
MRDESREHESLAGNLRGKVVFSSDDEKLGFVEDVLFNRLSEVPEWFIVREEGRKSRRFIVPVAGFELQDGGLRIPYSAAHVENQPSFDVKRGLGEESETALDHYFRLGSPQ